MNTSSAPSSADSKDLQTPLHLDELPRRIFRTSILWKAALDAQIKQDGLEKILSAGSGLILFSLFERDGQAVGDLAKQAKVSHVAVLHLIQRLETAGLVLRKTRPEDKRVTGVWLTAKGRKLEPRLSALHERNLQTLVGILGRQDAIQLGMLLEKLLSGLSELSGTLPSGDIP